MKKLALFLPLILFVLLGVFLYRGLYKDPNAMPSALLDKPFPEFSLRKLTRPDELTTRQELLGKPLLVNVWATWCGACRIEHPFLNELAAQGITIVGVNYKDNPPEAIRWLNEKGDPYAYSLMDMDGRLGFDLGVFGAPETYVVDAQGVIRFKHVGVLNEAVWAKDIQPLMQHPELQYSEINGIKAQ